VSEMSTSNGNGSPTRIPELAIWFQGQLDALADRLEKSLDDAMREPNRRLDGHDDAIAVLTKQVAGEQQARSYMQGSLNTWKWIAGMLGLPGILALAGLALGLVPKP